MNSQQQIPDEALREVLFLSLEDQDIEVRLRKLEEMLEELNKVEPQEDV